LEPINYNDTKKMPIIFSDEGSEWQGDLASKPEMEQQLFIKQEQYYKEKNANKKQKIWSDMFVLVQKYSKSLILKKNKGRKYRDPGDVDDDATQTALAFMSQYIYRPGYHVGASFAGMLNPKVLETLYKHSKEDSNYSLNSLVGDTNLELEDMQHRIGFEAIYKNDLGVPGDFIDNVDLKKVLNKVIREFNVEVKDETTQLKLMFYVYLMLRRSKNKHVKPMFMRHIAPNKKEYDLINLFELEFKDRILAE